MASKSGLIKKDIVAALDAFTSTIIETLAKKDTVTLIGFGTFSTSKEHQEKVLIQVQVQRFKLMLLLLLNLKLVKQLNSQYYL
jgi:DNA-binding protein HU-beta